ncbi:hypothetical protein, partial [Cellulosimicrobium sp. 22601]|uniref:hypothetical protein n=1 Tax=unclassified Cellulosimicrobium TaxID=2624466 RepID=UPI003F84EBD3
MNNAHHQDKPSSEQSIRSEPTRVHKTGINTKDDIIFRNQPKESQTQPTTPPDGRRRSAMPQGQK